MGRLGLGKASWRATTLAMMALLVLTPAAAQDEPEPVWEQGAGSPVAWDWIQLTSREWLKGELVAMFDHELEFDSDELDLQTFDWEDVHRIRTGQVMAVGLLDGTVALGRLVMEGRQARVDGDEVWEFDRSQILSITSGAPTEFSHWSGKVSLGLTVRQGNVDQVDTNIRAGFKRRSVGDRIALDYLANFSENEGTELANNQRFNGNWDHFITNRFFVRPVVVEWYRDIFQNIDSRSTVGAGAGYQIYDTGRTDWQVTAGLGYQRTRFVEVEPGEPLTRDTPAFSGGTIFDQEWTDSIDFVYEYTFQLTNVESGQYSHHMVMAFETEWTSVLDFDLTFVWDRTEKPRPDEEGVVPEQDDFRMVVGLGIEF